MANLSRGLGERTKARWQAGYSTLKQTSNATLTLIYFKIKLKYTTMI